MRVSCRKFLPLFLAFLLVSCDSEKEKRTVKQPDLIPVVPGVEIPADPIWAEYIARHTSGTISRESDITIDFVRDIIPEARIGTDASAVVDFSPTVEARVTFDGRRRIKISPIDPLESGNLYDVVINNSELENIPASLENYSFSFQVIPRDFEVRIHTMSSAEKTVLLSGQVTTSDREDNVTVESLVEVDVPGQYVSLSWEHSSAGTHHEFYVHDIQRGPNEINIRVIWDGSPMGLDRDGEHPLVVPPLGEFKVTQVSAVDPATSGGRKYIEVFFSEDIDSGQNLKGLISLGDSEYTTRIEGNRLSIYPKNPEPGAYTVIIEKGVKSAIGAFLNERLQRDVYFEMQDPQVRFVGKGVILPDNPVLSIPFETINARSVKVTAFRIYEDKIGQFLQNNGMAGSAQLGRVGRFLWRKEIALGQVESNTWNRFAVDATELLQTEPGALYRLTLSIDRGDSLLSCTPADEAKPVETENAFQNHDDSNLTSSSGWDYADDYYSPNAWQDRRNPCKDAYYKHSSKTRAHRNFLPSNLGLIAKRGPEGTLKVVTTDIGTSQPIAGVNIEVRSFQDQLLGEIQSDTEGFAALRTDTTPFYLIANKDKDYGYLKVNAATALPLSHFDVGGEKVIQGVKGYIYGERGVWRPGDTIHLTFVLEDKNSVIPDDHPVTMQLYDPKGQLMQSRTNSAPVNGFYTFKMKTVDNAITGNWTAKALLGGNTFSKPLKIETVIPNRLKVETTFEGDSLSKSSMPVKGKLFAQWLHGADANRLKADVSVRLAPRPTRFTRNADFVFSDPARTFKSEPVTVFEGKLDETGNKEFQAEIFASEQASGMLTAHFTSRVFEDGGNFSTSHSSMPYHPYDHYVGIKMPEGDASRNMLLTDTAHVVEIASLNQNGEPVSLPAVEVSVYKISWKWWWDQSSENLANYMRTSHRSFIKRDVVSTTDGSGTWSFDIKYPDWGRYLVRACDLNGKHCAGKTIYVDWPGWAGRAKETGGAGANALTLQSDKRQYKVGEKAVITLPPATEGRALISVETGSKILEQRWIVFSEQQVQFPIELTHAMSPNVYVSVTLIQPHVGKKNDRPIRLYGVVPIEVENPDTRLQPELKTANEWSPASRVDIEVSESSGRQMTYTLAVVDEGLLGLTSFRTPDLHKHFYKKEALGVHTWDLYDQVAGAYGAELERLLSLGGDEEAEDETSSQEKKRFPPVVRFLGPFVLDSNEIRKHSLDIPQYIGAVRVMVVAGSEENTAYGSTDKSVFVRGDLSLLATVPRVIGPEEELTVPIALFTMREDIKAVELSSEVSEHFEVVGESNQTLVFDAPGEQLGQTRFRVKPVLGKGRLKFVATSGEYQAEAEIHISIRSANPLTLRQHNRSLDKGDDWKKEIIPHGIEGTNQLSLEMSSIPPVNLNRRLNYLIRYPHGCVEQVTSSVFPQLYLPSLVKLGPEKKAEVQSNINAGIERLRRYQLGNGAFSYWPGWSNNVNDWANNYVGHFLIEARKQGYHIPADMMHNWIAYQTQVARNWITGPEDSRAAQIYRLYTLALVNSPDIAAMNRMRTNGDLLPIERWQLAAAYAMSGLLDAATELTQGVSPDVRSWRVAGMTFGSALRDRAIYLDAMSVLQRHDQAEDLAEDISDELYADKWHSTQSVAFSLSSLARYVSVEDSTDPVSFDWQLGEGKVNSVEMETPLHQQVIGNFPLKGEQIRVSNESSRKLYLSVISEGRPRAGEEIAVSKGLRLRVSYKDNAGRSIKVSELTQGQDFVAEVTIHNLNDHRLDNIALIHVVPPGWEIHNARLSGEAMDTQLMDYQDIRDDRVMTYFSLDKNKEKTFDLKLNATYLGRYYQPGIRVEAMYDGDNHARTKGQWVTVVKEGMQ